MPTSSGPNISGEGSLVFAYDVADIRNSYLGEPTTNLLPTPSINAIPKLGNGWGTYNTNQYRDGNFFSIGTISSVSSNIVTTAGSHTLRTYDVVQPQTTGGGVTAYTNYFVKKISDTQFSLHEYNSSQDGSQGYINPSTGYFKVHDSISTDARVSINSTDFPTMWWGAPHLPNSGLVKEIISNGFKDPYTGITTDCMRLHWYRPDGITDGMAYGVDAGFTANQTVCCSFWMKAVSDSAVGKYVNFYHYTYNVTSPTAYSMNATIGPVGEWRRYSYTFNSPNNIVISYWFPSYGPMNVDISNIQIEQKDHATQFIAGTRSNTQGLLDLTAKSSVSLVNASFNSNAQIVFDGTNDYVNVPHNSSQDLTNQGTISVWINPASLTQGSFAGLVAKCSGGGANQQTYTLSWRQISNALLGQICNGSGTYNEMYAPLPTTANVWYNIVFLWNGSSLIMYNNGVVISTATQTINSQVLSTDLTIGGYTYKGAGGGGEYFNGSIAKVEIYNRALGVSEVLNNYIAYKSRFNLS